MSLAFMPNGIFMKSFYKWQKVTICVVMTLLFLVALTDWVPNGLTIFELLVSLSYFVGIGILLVIVLKLFNWIYRTIKKGL